jgi:hypothetical protein
MSRFPNDDPNAYHAAGMSEPGTTSGKAISSLILGLSSFICIFFTGIPAIVLGALGLADINRSGGRLHGRGLAIGGIVLGSIGIGSTIIALGILVALLPPRRDVARNPTSAARTWTDAAQMAAHRNTSSNQLKLIGIAVHSYYGAFKILPSARGPEQPGGPPVSWRVKLLPYLEGAALAHRYKKEEPWNGPNNRNLLGSIPQSYAFKGGPETPTTNFVFITGPGTMFPDDEPLRFKDIHDRVSNTIVGVELAGTGIAWTEPRDITVEEFVAAVRNPQASGLRPLYPGGVFILLGDASVRFISDDTPPQTLRALCTRAGNENVDVSSLQ